MPLLILVALFPGRASAQSGKDSANVAAVVHQFHRLLLAGDSAGVLALLAPDLTVMESGEIEPRAEYRAHHLPADIAFVQAVPATTGPIKVVVQGEVAWAMSTSRSTGRFDGRAIDSDGAELLVLSRTPGCWQIRAIHWSSRSHRRPG